MTIYYVKSTGGTGAGTSDATAWSLAKLSSMYQSLLPGDQVKFLQGDVFNGSFNPGMGSAGNPVIYSSYNNGVAGANPIINGLTTVSGWTLSSGNIYYATVNFSGLQGVYLDGNFRAMGRYPNSGYVTYTSHTSQSGGSQSITGSGIGSLPQAFTGAELVIKKWRYILDRHIITGRSGNTLTYSIGNTATGINNSYDPTDGNGFFIQGHLGCLDIDGDWYYDNTAHRLYMYFNGSPSSRTVKVNSVNVLVPLNSTTYTTFSGIDFIGGNIALDCSSISNIIINNCNFKNQSGRCSIYANGATALQVNGGSIRDNNNTGLLIEQNAVSCVIDGLVVDNIGMTPGAGWSGDHGYVGIWTNGSSSTVQNCSVTNIGYVGIGSFDSSNWLVKYNFISNTGSVKDDGGGIYCFNNVGVVSSNRVIQYNIVLNSIGCPDGAQANADILGEQASIYIDGYSNHTIVDSNICAYGPWMGIFINSNTSNNVTNNLVYDFLFGLLISNNYTNAVRNMDITGNSFIARTVGQVPVRIDLLNVADSPQNFGFWNNNYYARPISETADMVVQRFYSGGGGATTYTLSQWKSTFGIDASSNISQVTTDADNKLRFEYNATRSSVVKSLGDVYKDITNTIYNGNITLPQFGGALLIYDSPLAVLPTGTKVMKSTTGKVYKDPTGKVIKM